MKKAEIGWSFVVKLIIGLLIILALIFVAIKSKNWFANLFTKLGEIFG